MAYHHGLLPFLIVARSGSPRSLSGDLDCTTLPGTEDEGPAKLRCEGANDQRDGYKYVYNSKIGTSKSECGKRAKCLCCRKPADEGLGVADCVSTCPSFPVKQCGEWLKNVFHPWEQATKEMILVVWDGLGSGLGEALDLAPYFWAFKHRARIDTRTWSGRYWCGLNNFTRLDVMTSTDFSHYDFGDYKPPNLADESDKTRHRYRLWKPRTQKLKQAAFDGLSYMHRGVHQKNGRQKDMDKIRARPPNLEEKCAFHAATCPSLRVHKTLAPVRALLPERFVALHLRGVGVGAPWAEHEFLTALADPIPGVVADNWLAHAKQVDKFLKKRCDVVKQKPWGSESVCACPTQFETMIRKAQKFCGNCDFPMFFATDLAAVEKYVRDNMRRWLVASPGSPWHFRPAIMPTQKSKGSFEKHEFPLLGMGKNKSYLELSKASTFVDFSLLTTASWLVGTRKTSDFSKLPADFSFGKSMFLEKTCLPASS